MITTIVLYLWNVSTDKQSELSVFPTIFFMGTLIMAICQDFALLSYLTK